MTGYDAGIFMRFVKAHAAVREDGQYTHMAGLRLTESHRAMLARWQKLDVIPLDKVDRFLHQYDLMTFEFEHWSEATGEGDPYRELAAA